jgi:hypothetical protein
MTGAEPLGRGLAGGMAGAAVLGWDVEKGVIAEEAMEVLGRSCLTAAEVLAAGD